jgi:hypothetical protein
LPTPILTYSHEAANVRELQRPTTAALAAVTEAPNAVTGEKL